MTQPEFQRLFELSEANTAVADFEAAATADEMAALAKRFDVKALSNVTLKLDIAPHSFGYRITGTISAVASQTCVITQKPLENRVLGDIDYLAVTQDDDLDLDTLEESFGIAEAERFEGDVLDLGELAAQYLGLAIDPFPRARGAHIDSDIAAQKHSPFSVLSQLKDKG
ncbi:MAG: hypothetical protein AAGJ09_09825 [Pseudomonadota bacterium]